MLNLNGQNQFLANKLSQFLEQSGLDMYHLKGKLLSLEGKIDIYRNDFNNVWNWDDDKNNGARQQKQKATDLSPNVDTNNNPSSDLVNELMTTISVLVMKIII